ncbi:MAG: S41 family peptidase [Bacteroidaceae bacterium]|nr:S41 family peptidase [Bacteroidaceae bacterium]
MIKKLLTYLLPALLLTGCVEEDQFSNSPMGNYDALWSIIDERYCFFEQARQQHGLDWDDVYHKYKPQVQAAESNAELFDIYGNMLRELKDGHVNLTSDYGTTYYWDWSLNHPLNFSDSLQRNYLGNDFRLTNGIKYTTLPSNIGYIYVGSFEGSISSDNVSLMLLRLAESKGIIIDIRNNGGGMLTSAEELAAHFVSGKTHCGYIQHKTGKGHNDFSSPEKLYIEPNGVIWKKPVVVLTNRAVYSSANHFVMLVKPLPQVVVIGDKTGGGSGLPLNSTLPNGWTVRFSACPILDIEGKHTEFGITPHEEVQITSADWNNGRDTIIERAIELINSLYEENNNKKD